MNEPVLSIFPGIGLLDRGFEQAGFWVMRGPDPLFGGDIRRFFPRTGHIVGLIGGPPCQNFSGSNRDKDFEKGMELVREYLRVLDQSQPEWALMENVAGSPVVSAAGYQCQLFTLNARHVGSDQHRLRKFHFFHRPGTPELTLQRQDLSQFEPENRTCMASEGKRSNRRTWAEFCRLQGLPEGFDLPGFTMEEKYRAVGNGVPYPLACALANAIRNRDRGVTPHRVCECGCGEFITGKERLASAACRKREQRKRDSLRTVTPAASQVSLF
ncbi:MAG TPA: DNA cytosine methyltransferase [Verrucomicrobiae bacterium]|nr:DNA cytosine methyltransferase [Verrucomicrobiae bacterium]